MDELIKRWLKRGRAEHSRMYLLTLQRMLPKLVNILAYHPVEDIIVLDTTNRSIFDTLRALMRDLQCLRIAC